MSCMVLIQFPVLEFQIPYFLAVDWVLRYPEEILEGRPMREVCEYRGDKVFFSGLGPDPGDETDGLDVWEGEMGDDFLAQF